MKNRGINRARIVIDRFSLIIIYHRGSYHIKIYRLSIIDRSILLRYLPVYFQQAVENIQA